MSRFRSAQNDGLRNWAAASDAVYGLGNRHEARTGDEADDLIAAALTRT